MLINIFFVSFIKYNISFNGIINNPRTLRGVRYNTILVFTLLFALFSMNESNVLIKTFGDFVSHILRKDILDIITCILHNDSIIYDLNVIIDAILTFDFNQIIIALTQVVFDLKDQITKCIDDPTKNLLK